MKRFLITAVGAAMALTPAFGQQTKILTPEKHNEYGLVYSLPTTALQVNVLARKITRKAGPYHQYAKKSLGVSNVITRDAVEWQIVEIDVVPVGVNDGNTQYIMQLKPGATTFIGVASDGMLLSINAEPEEKAPAEPRLKQPASSTTGSPDDYLQYVDMDFISAQSSMRQAEMIASSLMDVRDAYLSLTRGTADNQPSDGRQLELMLASLHQQEDALTRAFTGSEDIQEYSRQFVYIPDEEGSEVLFRLSDFEGFVPSDDYSGRPVTITTEVLQEGTLPEDTNGEKKKFPKDGVVYAIPGTARVTIDADGKRLFDREMEFAQFGTVFGLAPSLFTDKKAPSYARFNPATGALEEIGTIQK